MEIKQYPTWPVLLVDDETQFLQSASFSLRSSGINNIVKCQDSRKVFSLLSERQYSIILLDILMPHLTGREILPKITEKYPNTPVIMLTALTEVETAVECMKNGAFDYMVKPVNKMRLVTNIKRAIEFNEMRNENADLTRSLQMANSELKAKSEKQEELVLKLSKSTSQLKTIIDASFNVILLVDPENRIVEVNNSVENFFGITPESIKGQSFNSFSKKIEKCFEDYQKFEHVIQVRQNCSIEEQRENFITSLDREFRLKLLKPIERIISVFSVPVSKSNDSDMGTVWSFKDITTLVRVGDQLHTIVEASPVPLIISNVENGQIIYSNENLCRLSGYTQEEMKSKFVTDFYANPKERELLISNLKRDGIVRNHEICFKDKNGKEIWTLVSLALTFLNNKAVIVGGIYDISMQKQAILDVKKANRNLQEAQSHLIQSEKMASLGMLVAGIAHEINTPVGAIASMHDTLIRAAKKLETLYSNDIPIESVNKNKIQFLFSTIGDANHVIGSATSRVIEIVKRLRSFARLDEAELKKIDIKDSIDDTLVILNHKLKHGITVEKNYNVIPQIYCFPGQINQVFLNILNNACQAIHPPGTITIETGQMNHNIYIKIRDTGFGIPDKELPKIFDPGFTTKGVGVGTGLGLSITYQIIQDHKGNITAESTIGKGTTFIIELPIKIQ